MFAAPPQTPQRQLPGAYVQTPAQTRPYQLGQTSQPNLRTSTVSAQQQYGSQGQNQQNGQATRRPQVEELKPVERASRTINQTFEQESRYPALDTYVSSEH